MSPEEAVPIGATAEPRTQAPPSLCRSEERRQRRHGDSRDHRVHLGYRQLLNSTDPVRAASNHVGEAAVVTASGSPGAAVRSAAWKSDHRIGPRDTRWSGAERRHGESRVTWEDKGRGMRHPGGRCPEAHGVTAIACPRRRVSRGSATRRSGAKREAPRSPCRGGAVTRGLVILRAQATVRGGGYAAAETSAKGRPRSCRRASSEDRGGSDAVLTDETSACAADRRRRWYD